MPDSSSLPHLSGETAALVSQVVDELARRLEPDILPSPGDSVDAVGSARERALTRLRVLAGVKQAIRHLEDQAAHAAAANGAGYPEIGRALSMSRQGARRRWPGLITITSSTHHPSPHPTPRSS